MSESAALKAKLGLDVFKPLREAHIRIRPGMEKDARLKPAVRICPAGCYSENEQAAVVLNVDGCLECGTCRIICTTYRNVDWEYPRGGYGILFKFG
jgi:ferredoxin like protein